MATVKIKFRPSTVDGGEGTIYYQIIHNRVPRQINTEYRIYPEEWSPSRSMVSVSNDHGRLSVLKSIRDHIRWDMERIGRIINSYEDKGVDYTADDVVEAFKEYSHEYTLFNYIESTILRFKQMGKVGTATNYRSALNSFKKFRSNEDLSLDCISADLMERYEAWLHERGICPNTISFYMRILRAVYNRAVEQEVITDRNPFARVYTGVDKTVKRALTLKTVRKIKSIDLSRQPKLDFARDMFMLSFYLRGMSFVDMAFLRKSDLKDGEVTYRRRKTNQLLSIAWTKEMQQIIDKYPVNQSEYLLPIIKTSGCNERCTYRNIGYKINSALKKIGQMIGASDYKSWSMYRSRHSWASIAKAKGVPLSVISEGMGHDNEKTTEIIWPHWRPPR